MPPLQPLDTSSHTASHAPKLVPEDADVDWKSWSVAKILRTQRAIGPLWSWWPGESANRFRVKFHDIKVAPTSARPETRGEPGTAYLCESDDLEGVSTTIGGIWAIDGTLLCPRAITIEGGKKETPTGSVNVARKLLELSKGQ